MPGMNGIETSANISSIVKTWDFLPLIVGCSGDTSPSIQEGFVKAGVSYFLNKPITMNAILGLKSRINQYFSSINLSDDIISSSKNYDFDDSVVMTDALPGRLNKKRQSSFISLNEEMKEEPKPNQIKKPKIN